MGDARLRGVEAKLDRASIHLDSIKTTLREYLNENPYLLTGYVEDHESGPITVSIDPPPVELATIAGDCLHNLRSSLDHLAGELVKASGQQPNKDTFFPIVAVAPQLNRHGRVPTPQIAPCVSEQIRELLAPVQPYSWNRATGHPLRILSQLNNIDKHEMLTFGGYSVSQPQLLTGFAYGEWKTLRLLDDGAELGPLWASWKVLPRLVAK